MGVDRGTVRDWVNSGQLPATRDGREWRIPMPFVFYIAAVLKFERSAEPRYVLAVSYTHLDVYKRQAFGAQLVDRQPTCLHPAAQVRHQA